jgi:hypothetical protein
MPDPEVVVESEHKNKFTLTEFSVGKILWVKSVSLKSQNYKQVKLRFHVTRSDTLDCALADLRLIFRFVSVRLALPAPSCGCRDPRSREKPALAI